jgi:hypothetical protein
MANNRVNFTTPVGRLVAGSLYKGKNTDAEGRPLVVKSGPNAGQPRLDYYFAIAIPKGNESHWRETQWGGIIWAAGHAGMATAGQNPKFAWKVMDGSSEIPNAKNIRPCDREGWAGNWIVHFSSSYASKVYSADGSKLIPEPDFVKLGYFVQVNADVTFNGSMQQPGVFLSHHMVAFSAYGEEIYIGPDPAAAGFGAAPLPAGATTTPPAQFAPAEPPQLPPPAAAPAPVTPNPAFLNVPAATPAPVAPPPAAPVPPAAPARVMTAKAGGATYESFVASGWSDAQLIEHGYMTA